MVMLKQPETQVPFMNFISSSGILHLAEKDNAVLPDYLTLVLNSKIVRLQAERSAGGLIIQHWKQSEIENVSIPILPMSSQQKIAAKVRESFALRAESKRLLDLAKRAVEVAIERGKEMAIIVMKEILQ
jgi:type I restriction enzyme S subunit